MLFDRFDHPRRSLMVAPVFTAIALLAACGSSSPTTVTTPSTTPTAVETSLAAAGDSVPSKAIPADAAFNAADVTFAQGMIPHHEQAITMSATALDPARKAGPEVVDLATRIQGAQGPEITLMTGWLKTWAQPLHAAGGAHAGMDMGDGMMSDDDMKSLAAASGGEFDKLWTQMMIRHHQGAVTMANGIVNDGKSPEVKALGQKIITTQEAEIAELKDLLGA